jgi:hypothetical protein
MFDWHMVHSAERSATRLTRWALIALTAATIVAYFVLIQGQYDAVGIADRIQGELPSAGLC